ncbi:MAG: alpha/beta fold hydrolase [Comamonas sp.]|uniref:esterase/lipase family protein n=1 Tax=Comamonas sp. TaxID=34028 RepID=UPI00282B9A14|nr:alpha/beta fold hydrolase [Comamonas sp.]MDR0214417.1 alpha/beta fold hydrolase [Comamonas sp.]
MNIWFWRSVVLTHLTAALLWCGFWGAGRPWLAAAGVAVLACGAGAQLGLQMLLMRHVLRSRQLPMPSAVVVLRAWLAEWRLSLQIFGWRIPFRSQSEPDFWPASAQGQVGVVLVHGYFCSRAVWNPWLRNLRARDIACAAMTLEPAHGYPVDAMVADLHRCVEQMVRQTGRAPLLVAHSMGGLVVRAWLKTLTASQRSQYAAHVVTVATPHGGTWLARFAHRLPARDMREAGEWLQALGPLPVDVPMSCWCSSSDNIVFPPTLAMMEGAQQHQVEDAAHMQLLFDERVWMHCVRLRQQLQQRP